MSEPPSPDDGDGALLAVGRIARPHGLRGEVVVDLTTNRDERVAPGTSLVTADGFGLEMELVMSEFAVGSL